MRVTRSFDQRNTCPFLTARGGSPEGTRNRRAFAAHCCTPAQRVASCVSRLFRLVTCAPTSKQASVESLLANAHMEGAPGCCASSMAAACTRSASCPSRRSGGERGHRRTCRTARRDATSDCAMSANLNCSAYMTARVRWGVRCSRLGQTWLLDSGLPNCFRTWMYSRALERGKWSLEPFGGGQGNRFLDRRGHLLKAACAAPREHEPRTHAWRSRGDTRGSV